MILDLQKPSGLVLEAPFYNTLQALVSYPLTRVRFSSYEKSKRFNCEMIVIFRF